ncbi:hypothetical protein ACPB9E_12655 [Streptomyces exfoliatus]|uniref:hypothetical protein n=1 Tax=Streptomyces exfoliatus TaxID=1905 RepID=UPI003C30B167
MPEPVVAPRAAGAAPPVEGDELAATVSRLNSRPDDWDPSLVAASLSVLAERREDIPEWHYEVKILARGAAQPLRVYERLAPVIGVRKAALAVFAATAVLVHPVTNDGTTLSSGAWTLDRLCILFPGAGLATGKASVGRQVDPHTILRDLADVDLDALDVTPP